MSLDPRLLVDLRSLAAELQARGELLPVDRLDRLYALFRARFGPESLAGLDGEALLLKMHGRGDARDSLAYWLEFKNDDEFPTSRMGGIGGGSALKYGIYRRAETGQWMTGTGTRQVVITAVEAAAIAGKQRDELVAGARVLEQARREPSTIDYPALQAAPDITVLRHGQRFILDAKYRDLSRGPLPREILYQLTMYAASQGPGGAAAMIYPRHEAASLPQERLDLFDPLHTSPHASLYLRPVPLLELAASLDAGEQGVAFRRRLARTLAFGTAGPVVAHALVTSA